MMQGYSLREMAIEATNGYETALSAASVPPQLKSVDHLPTALTRISP